MLAGQNVFADYVLLRIQKAKPIPLFLTKSFWKGVRANFIKTESVIYSHAITLFSFYIDFWGKCLYTLTTVKYFLNKSGTVNTWGIKVYIFWNAIQFPNCGNAFTIWKNS